MKIIGHNHTKYWAHKQVVYILHVFNDADKKLFQGNMKIELLFPSCLHH